ncbi:hypothetical protein JCM17380_16870 [Desulfosporosinus burensis]
MNGYLEKLGGQYLCRFSSENCWPELHGTIPIICCTFQVSQRYDIENYMNCFVLNINSRKISICDLEIGYLIKPNFIDLIQSSVGPLNIHFTREDIELIESARKDGDVQLLLNLEVLIALDKVNRHGFEELFKMNLVLNTSIPKSKWLETFLPAWNYFYSREKIIFLDSLDSKIRVKELIAAARKSFAANDYHGTITRSYIALEAIPKELWSCQIWFSP